MQIDTPLTHDVDLLVIGASSGAVEAAVSAAHEGCRVLCVTRYTYPGEDLCAPMAYWPDADVSPQTDLARALLPDLAPGSLPRPMHIKHTLEGALVEAGVECLYMSHVVRLLWTPAGVLGGAVIANRSGFQAVRAAAMVDATQRATVARLLPEVDFLPFASGEYEARLVVAGERVSGVAEGRLVERPGVFQLEDRALSAYCCTTRHQIDAPTPGSMAAVEVECRVSAWYPGQLVSADCPGVRFGDRMQSDRPQQEWSHPEALELEALRAGHHPLFVLDPRAAVTDSVAAALEQPAALMAVGERLGRQVALEAKRPEGELSVAARDWPLLEGVDVVRHDRYFRPRGVDTVRLDLNRIPVLGEYDVVVAGGGTAGAPAGIAAARAGARTLILEYLPGLGGMTTRGRIASYYHGNRCGFTSEVDEGVHGMGTESEVDTAGTRWNTEWKEQWFLRAAREAGAEVWLHALTVAAARTDDRVCGVVVATPYGFGLVRAGVVVDASGNADVAAAAGAETVKIEAEHLAVQGTGLGPFVPGDHYTNTDHTFVDDTDVVDVTRAFHVGREKFGEAFDLTQVVDSRQRQQIRGDLTLQPLDFLAGRTFPDTVVTARSNFDSHGFTIHPVFMAMPPDKQSHWAHVPLRCLLPADLDGILVTGLGVSCHRDALPVIRMQPDVQNQGYAAGRVAATAALSGSALRDVDVGKLQQHLVEVGILACEVVDHEDSFPLDDAAFARAVEAGIDEYLGLAVIFSDPGRSLPLLRRAYGDAPTPERGLRYAHVLGLLGDATGVDALMAGVDGEAWDQGWHYTGMGQFGFSLSPVDSMLAALGRAGDRRALPVILRKLEALRPEQEFSHIRAMTLALEAMPTPEATPRLAELLERVGGNAIVDMAEAVRHPAPDRCDTSERNRELKELLLARGLLACGDHQEKGREVLLAYSEDLHGHYARHARALLAAASV